MIEEEYRSHFLVDNLPVAMSVFHETEEGSTVKAYETGYPLGHVVDENGKSPEGDGEVSSLLFVRCCTMFACFLAEMTHIHTNKHTHIHTYIHTSMYMHIYIHTYIHI